MTDPRIKIIVNHTLSHMPQPTRELFINEEIDQFDFFVFELQRWGFSIVPNTIDELCGTELCKEEVLQDQL